MTATPATLAGLHVGASGFSYPSWRPGFYPAGTRPEDFLAYYAARFDTVELNSTGYRLPAREQFERWGRGAPPGFRFAPKLTSLRTAAAFCERARALGEALGPIRVVLTMRRDDALLERLLGALDPDLRFAFDLRHESWAGARPVLEAAGIARVGAFEGAAPFRYLRLREPPYDDGALAAWAGHIRPLLAGGIEVYCYVRHEGEPAAPRYAARLLELCVA